MTTRLVLASTSLVEDGAYQAMADIATAAAGTGTDYRVIGGHMVTVHVSRSGVVLPPRATADTSRVRHNRAVGDLFVDEVPGLRYALARPAVTVDLEVRLTAAVTLSLRPAIPELTAALCLQVLAYHSRGERRDAFDVWRLLEVARADGLTASDWPDTPTPTRVAELLRSEFVPANGRGVLDASTSTPTRVRLRVLATALAGPV